MSLSSVEIRMLMHRVWLRGWLCKLIGDLRVFSDSSYLAASQDWHAILHALSDTLTKSCMVYIILISIAVCENSRISS
jgi:hypothetical protein